MLINHQSTVTVVKWDRIPNVRVVNLIRSMQRHTAACFDDNAMVATLDVDKEMLKMFYLKQLKQTNPQMCRFSTVKHEAALPQFKCLLHRDVFGITLRCHISKIFENF